VLFPEHPTLAADDAIFRGGVVTRATIVSILITLVGTALSVTVVTMLAYALSRPGTFAHRPILLMVLFTMLFSAGLNPNYLVIKQLGLLDSYWALILPTMVSGFQVILMRGFFLEVPTELIEAARIDGASELRILTTIMVPLSKAALAVIALFNAVTYWNAFFNAVLYINSTEKWPLQLVLQTYVVDSTSVGVRLAQRSSPAADGDPRRQPGADLPGLPVPAKALRQGRDDRRGQGLIEQCTCRNRQSRTTEEGSPCHRNR
jgi:multiple sugar transport system permease protein/putative aldouronate transport system permease protein